MAACGSCVEDPQKAAPAAVGSVSPKGESLATTSVTERQMYGPDAFERATRDAAASPYAKPVGDP